MKHVHFIVRKHTRHKATWTWKKTVVKLCWVQKVEACNLGVTNNITLIKDGSMFTM